MTYMEILGKKIKELREEMNIPQQKIADILGVSRQSLSLYEKGERTINVESLGKLSQFFGVSSDYLLGLSDIKSTEQDIKTACEVTGLSEKAIDNIKSIYYTFPRLLREGTKQAIADSPFYSNDEKESITDYVLSESNQKEHIAVQFFESESFEKIMHCISEACAMKEEATRLMNHMLISDTITVEKINYAKNQNAQYKAAILDIYGLVKEFIESYTTDKPEEVINNAQHHETKE